MTDNATTPAYTLTRDQWLAALRSGDYKQTDGLLYQPAIGGDAEGFCCLGVGCRVAGFELDDLKGQSFVPASVVDELQDAGDRMAEDESEYFPLTEALGLTVDQLSYLATLNDHSFTFKQIAVFIERGCERDDYMQMMRAASASDHRIDWLPPAA